MQTVVNHTENIGLVAGIVLFERTQILIGLECVTLAAQKVAKEYESSCKPVIMRRIGIYQAVHSFKGFGILPGIGIMRCQVESTLCTIQVIDIVGKRFPDSNGFATPVGIGQGKRFRKGHLTFSRSTECRRCQQPVGSFDNPCIVTQVAAYPHHTHTRCIYIGGFRSPLFQCQVGCKGFATLPLAEFHVSLDGKRINRLW